MGFSPGQNKVIVITGGDRINKVIVKRGSTVRVCTFIRSPLV